MQKSLALDRKMKELGQENPYVVLLEPPGDYGRLRRHKHARFKFSMREGTKDPRSDIPELAFLRAPPAIPEEALFCARKGW